MPQRIINEQLKQPWPNRDNAMKGPDPTGRAAPDQPECLAGSEGSLEQRWWGWGWGGILTAVTDWEPATAADTVSW